MRDMSIDQTVELEQVSPARERMVPDAEALAQIQVEARRLQGQALRRVLGRWFSRMRPEPHEDAMEEAFHRCHKRDAEVLRRLGETAARALSRRAVTGNVSDHLLGDIGLTRRDVDGFHASSPRVYNPDVGSTAA